MTRGTASSAAPARASRARRKGRRGEVLDEATSYARDVVAGRVPACLYVRQAAARHLEDLRTADARGLQWDVRSAQRALAFMRSLRHTRGGRGYFNLQPWQAFVVGSIFGWRRRDGRRRYTHAYVEIPRKNGKSELAAAIVLYATFFDDPLEMGARGYVAATKRDQAKEVFGAAKTMVRNAPAHRRYVRVLTHVLSRADTDSRLEALGADADTLDGLNPSCVIIDELHKHKTAAVVEVLDSATGSREQPLQVEITTAGVDRVSICWQHHEFSTQILDPESPVEQDSWFAVIYTIDEGDRWDDEAAWRKANPNYGVSVKPEWVAKQCTKARRLPSARDEFRQKILNEWRNVGDRAIQFGMWDRGAPPTAEPFTLEQLRGRVCWIGMDLARTRDLSAIVAVFPPAADDKAWRVLGRYYCPEENIERRSEEDRVPYREFVASGHLIATPGEVTDHTFIVADLLQWAAAFNVRELVYDEVMASDIVTRMQAAGLTCVPQSQTAKAMILPTAEYMKLVFSGRLWHNGDPVMRWAAGNLIVRRGATGETSPDKKKSREKIDPIVAGIMAVGRAVLDVEPQESVYETRGPLLVR